MDYGNSDRAGFGQIDGDNIPFASGSKSKRILLQQTRSIEIQGQLDNQPIKIEKDPIPFTLIQLLGGDGDPSAADLD